MRVPLTTRDFLDRAELVYGDRVGDRRRADPARALARRGHLPRGRPARRGRCRPGSTRSGIGEGERVAIVSHNSGRLLELLLSVPSSGRVLVPINFRLSPEEVSYIVGHSGARVLLVDPELETSLKGVEAEHRFGTGEEYEQLLRFDTEPAAVGRARRGRHRHDQLHQRDDGAAQGRADDPPQHLGQRGHLRHAHAGQRPRRLPAHAADVPLQRLGPAVHDGRARGAAGGAAQDRRRGDPAPRRASTASP